MRKNYNTKQKSLILSCLIQNKEKCITVNDIVKYLNSNNNKVGTTTIYRCLEYLEKNNMVKKFNENNISKYQYIDEFCLRHSHLKCNKCGKLIHLECSEINDLNLHVIKNHGFKMDNIIYGICDDCEANNEKN